MATIKSEAGRWLEHLSDGMVPIRIFIMRLDLTDRIGLKKIIFQKKMNDRHYIKREYNGAKRINLTAGGRNSSPSAETKENSAINIR